MRLSIFLLLAGAALSPAPGAAMTDPGPRRSTDQPHPRDGNVAIREEFEAARRAGTVAAYDLFLRRHGDHPLAEAARRERAQLAQRPKGGSSS